MRHDARCRIALCVLAQSLVFAATARARRDEPIAKLPEAHEAISPAAPVLPAVVVAAMQEHRYGDAAQALEALVAGAKEPDASYFKLMLASARRLEGRPELARKTLDEALKGQAGGVWRTKLRYKLARVELALKNFDAAETVLSGIARDLLGADRGQALARMHEELADSLLSAGDEASLRDAIAACDLFKNAAEFVSAPKEKVRFLRRAIACDKKVGNCAAAISSCDKALALGPESRDAAEIRLTRAECLATLGRRVAARRALADLERDLKGTVEPALVNLRAQALFQYAVLLGATDALAETAAPPELDEQQGQAEQEGANRQIASKRDSETHQDDSDDSMSQEDAGNPRVYYETRERTRMLAAAALERLINEYPAHPLAVRAAFAKAALFAEPTISPLEPADVVSVDDDGPSRSTTRDNSERTRKTLKLLERPIELPFPTETPLSEFLDYIKTYAARRWNETLEIHVDPIVLQEADKSMRSTVVIDLKTAPLRFGLKVALDQLGLDYIVGDGVIKLEVQRSEELASGSMSYFSLGGGGESQSALQSALEAHRRFLKQTGFTLQTDEAKRDYARLEPYSLFETGVLLDRLTEHDEAISTWRSYLMRFPSGPHADLARGAILNAEIHRINLHLMRRRYEAVRREARRFVQSRPLDRRTVYLLDLIAQSFRSERKWGEAIASWREILASHPLHVGAESARRGVIDALIAQKDRAGAIRECKAAVAAVEAGRESGDLESYKERLDELMHPDLSIDAPGGLRSDGSPALMISAEGSARLAFAVYKINPEAFFRKKHLMTGVEALDLDLVAPDHAWTVARPQTPFAPYEWRRFDLQNVKPPGVYAIRVSDDRSVEATVELVGSDLGVTAQSSNRELFVYAWNVKTAAPWPNARILVSDGSRIALDAKTGADGALLAQLPDDRAPSATVGRRLLAIADGHVAACNVALARKALPKLEQEARIVVAGGAHRPGDLLHVFGLVRDVVNGGRFTTQKGEAQIAIIDPTGGRLIAQTLNVDALGVFSADVALPGSAPLGAYVVSFRSASGRDFSSSFFVTESTRARLALKIACDREVVARGESVTGKAELRDDFDQPVAGANLAIRLPSGRTVEGPTGADGALRFRYDTADENEESLLTFRVSAPEEGLADATRAFVARSGFDLSIKTPRVTCNAGEIVPVEVAVAHDRGFPAGPVTLALEPDDMTLETAELAKLPKRTLTLDPQTRMATTTLKLDGVGEGTYYLTASARDGFGNLVEANRYLTIGVSSYGPKLVFDSDRVRFKVGETARIKLVNFGPAATAIVTWRTDAILLYRRIALAPGENAIEWTVAPEQAPNVTVSAARIEGGRVQDTELDLEIDSAPIVRIDTAKPTLAPREALTLSLAATDSSGRPIRARSVIAMHVRSRPAESLPASPQSRSIEAAWDARDRRGVFASAEEIELNGDAVGAPIDAALVEEGERQAQAKKGEALEDQTAEAARSEVSFHLPARVPDQSKNRMLRGAGGMFGGMGAMGGGMFNTEPESDALIDAPVSVRIARALQTIDRNGKPAEPNEKVKAEARRADGDDIEYWNSAVNLDPGAPTQIPIAAPASPGVYVVEAWCMSESASTVGRGSIEITVRSDWTITPAVPDHFVAGDRPRITAVVSNATDRAGKAKVTLEAEIGGRKIVDPKEIEIAGRGNAQVRFAPLEIGPVDAIELLVSASMGELNDRVTLKVPVRPQGVAVERIFAGVSNQDELVELAPWPGIRTTSTSLSIVVQPPAPFAVDSLVGRAPASPCASTIETAVRLSAALRLRERLAAQAPNDAALLTSLATTLVADLTTSQNNDGGWGILLMRGGADDRIASARALEALVAADRAGLLANADTLTHATAAASRLLGDSDRNDTDARAALLHALTVAGKPTFEQANALYRDRDRLSNSALAELALVLRELGHLELAAPAIDSLEKRLEAGPRGLRRPDGIAQAGDDEANARVLLALATVRPGSPHLASGRRRLLEASAFGPRSEASSWTTLALAATIGANPAGRFRVTITLGEQALATVDSDKPETQREIVVSADRIAAGVNRVRFHLEGGGAYAYRVQSSARARELAPFQDPKGKSAVVKSKLFTAIPTPLDGLPIPSGFTVAPTASPHDNIVTHTPLGARIRVKLQAGGVREAAAPAVAERRPIIVVDHIPAGFRLVAGSVRAPALVHRLDRGTLTLALAADAAIEPIEYDLVAVREGQFVCLPTEVRRLGGGELHVGQATSIEVIPRDAPSRDRYRAGPDELAERGRRLYERGALDAAFAPLEELLENYPVRDDLAGELGHRLFVIALKRDDPRKIVRYFEVFKEKAPETIVGFDEAVKLGESYRKIGESERAIIVWRVLIEGRNLLESILQARLRDRGRELEATAWALKHWRDYPGEPGVEGMLLAQSQALAALAGKAENDGALARKLNSANLTRQELLLQSIRLNQLFLAQAPDDPQADEASLALIGGFQELDDDRSVGALAERSAKLYPTSPFRDGFRFSRAVALFRLGELDRAKAAAEEILQSPAKTETSSSPADRYRKQAVYLLGQIHETQGDPGKALAFYKQAAADYPEAAAAVDELSRRELSLPDISQYREQAKPDSPIKIPLSYRNVNEIEVKSYPVDLMRLYLERKGLVGIEAIDLAGVTPAIESVIPPPADAAFERKTRDLPLNIKAPGAYLVLARSENLFASGIVLVSALELDVTEDPPNARARITVRDLRTRKPAKGVEVRFASDAGSLGIGKTDARGVFLAEGVSGRLTVIARREPSQYAFYRGAPSADARPAQDKAKLAKQGAGEKSAQTPSPLDRPLKELNQMNQEVRRRSLDQGGMRGMGGGFGGGMMGGMM